MGVVLVVLVLVFVVPGVVFVVVDAVASHFSGSTRSGKPLVIRAPVRILRVLEYYYYYYGFFMF